jgi:hypothetical protein
MLAEAMWFLDGWWSPSIVHLEVVYLELDLSAFEGVHLMGSK